MMNDCKRIRVLLTLRPQEWDADERRRVEAHLATCADCASRVNVYSEQDRLIRAMPRVNLTLSQREQLLSRISRERRRYGMQTKLSAILSTVMAVTVLVVVGLGMNFLIRGYVQPSLDAPSGSSYPTDADQALWMWIDAARDKDLAHRTTTVLQRQPWWDGEVILFTYEDDFADGGRQRVLSWILAEPNPSGLGWAVTTWGNREVVHWPVDQEIPAPAEVGRYTFWLSERGDGPDRMMSVIYGLRHSPGVPPETVQLIRNGQMTDVPLYNDSLLYVTEGGLIEERPGIRWACDAPGDGWCAAGLRTDGQITIPEPLVFGGEIRSDDTAIDSLTGKPVPFIIGMRDTNPFAPGQLYTPVDVQWMLTWIVVAPPSADWVVFAHLMNEAGELVMQSDVPVDWPAQPCSEGEYSSECVAVTEHEWFFPASFPPGLYTIQVGLYDPVTGERAPITSPAGAVYPVSLGQVRVSVSEQDLESALASHFLDDPTALCEWQVWGESDQEMYLWAVCESVSGSAVSAPAVVRIGQGEGGVWRIQEIEVPRDGTFYGPDVRTLFPSEVQERIFAHDFDAEVALARIAERRAQMESVEPPGEFAIYLVDLDQGMSAQDALQVDLDELELADTPILAIDDIISYDWETHAITLTDTAYERLAQLQVPIAPGAPFVVCVGREPVYRGAFWASFSSASFDGIAIVLPPVEELPIRIQLGYPESLGLFTGEDLRSDPRILQALAETGKLIQ